MKHVLLLRARDEDRPDRYELAFQAKEYVPLSVPVLETVLVHIDALRDKIVHGPSVQGLSGVILTSKRAVEAWSDALRSITGTTQADWRTIPFYVVGTATATAISQIRTAFPSAGCLVPADVRGGAEAGTAERLAAFILAEGNSGPARRMLYLTGDKNRETLSRMLTTGGIKLETLEVYCTTGSSTFRADLQAALENAPIDRTRPGEPWGWVVYFAPSAAAFVKPALEEVFRFGMDREERRVLRVAAIGPTTASYLSEELRVQVDVVSTKPTPDALCGTIVAFDEVGP